MNSPFRQVTRIGSPGFLDFDLPEQLFAALERAIQRYKNARIKAIEDALFLVLGLTHLREWIAPGFRGQRAPKYPDERFSERLFQLESYEVLRNVANHAKHQARDHDVAVTSVHYADIDDWPEIDKVTSFDEGPVGGYYIENRELSELFEDVLGFYREQWFSLSDNERYGSLEERTQRVLDEDRGH
jgi:hypothetical protein